MSGKVTRSPLARLEEKYVPEPNSGCWIWMGATAPNPNGMVYGTFFIYGKTTKAHRAAWLIYRGDIGKLNVLHKCDVTLCVNPDHLWLGTQKENLVDCAAKGRKKLLRGSAHPRSKLSEACALEIRRSPLGGRRLSKMYGVCRSTIKAIRDGKTWII